MGLIKTKEIDFEYLMNNHLEFFEWTIQQEIKQSNSISMSETVWLLGLGYGSTNPERTERLAPACLQRIAKVFT
jgi:hypothetical protein